MKKGTRVCVLPAILTLLPSVAQLNSTLNSHHDLLIVSFFYLSSACVCHRQQQRTRGWKFLITLLVYLFTNLFTWVARDPVKLLKGLLNKCKHELVINALLNHWQQLHKQVFLSQFALDSKVSLSFFSFFHSAKVRVILRSQQYK